MTRASRGWIRAAAIAAAAAGACLGAGPAEAGTEAVLGARGVEAIARRVAAQWGDARPRDIRYASGTREDAMKLLAPSSGSNPSVSPAGPGAQSEVDLVAAWGRFTADVPGPRGAPAPKGTVLELLVDAHSGFVEMRSLGNRLPAPLSKLGRVDDLHRGCGGTARRGG